MIGVCFFVAAFPFAADPVAVEAPERAQQILKGSTQDALTGSDVLALERHAEEGARWVQQTQNVLDASCAGATQQQMDAQLVVGRRLLAVALLEAARRRSGTSMALTAAAEVALATNLCLPFGVGTGQAKELAKQTSSTTKYLIGHGALTKEDAASIAQVLRPLLDAQEIAALQKTEPQQKPLVQGTAAVTCRARGPDTILSAAEAREIGRVYQQRPPELQPAFRNGRMVGMQVEVDAFLTSCGFLPGDLVVTVNGIDVSSPDKLLLLEPRIRAERVANVVVLRNGKPVTLVIQEDKGSRQSSTQGFE